MSLNINGNTFSAKARDYGDDTEKTKKEMYKAIEMAYHQYLHSINFGRYGKR